MYPSNLFHNKSDKCDDFWDYLSSSWVEKKKQNISHVKFFYICTNTKSLLSKYKIIKKNLSIKLISKTESLYYDSLISQRI